MSLLRRAQVWSVAVTVSFVLFPFALQAQSMTRFLSTPETQVVTRGDFIRAAVRALGLPESPQKFPATDVRQIPRSLAPFVREAEEHHALDLFDTDLNLRSGITRGEAVYVLARLTDRKAPAATDTFTDVPNDSDFADAVAIALAQQWLKPVRAHFFGIRLPLVGREAQLLLGRIVRSETKTTQELP